MAATQAKTKAKAKAKAKPKVKVAEGAAKIVPMGAVALRSLTLQNVLSFGAEAKVELGPLNVLIGPNGCGKSNLVDVVALLKAAATTDLSGEFRGWAEDWVWNGAEGEWVGLSWMDIISCWSTPEEYAHSMRVNIRDGKGAYNISNGESIFYQGSSAKTRRIWRDDYNVGPLSDKNLISLLNPVMPIYQDERMAGFDDTVRRILSRLVGDVQVYRGRQVGRIGALNPLHLPSRTDKPIDHISETLDNFALVLNRVRLEQEGDIVKALREINDDARGLDVRISHNQAEVVLKEKNGNIPAHRMSDGMLNWLFLLTILLDPAPPPLVCIEEPETGLHPDMLPTLARMLIDASKRMQLIVTTHSDMIVDCFTDMPEAMVVCDKVDGVTQMKRLCAEDFYEWKKEGLGMAWVSGAIGGKRW